MIRLRQLKDNQKEGGILSNLGRVLVSPIRSFFKSPTNGAVLSLDEALFCETILQGLTKEGETLNKSIEDGFSQAASLSFPEGVSSTEPLSIKLKSNCDAGVTYLREAGSSAGCTLSHVELQVDFPLDSVVDFSSITLTPPLCTHYVAQNDNFKPITIKHKRMKTRERYVCKIIGIKIDPSAFFAALTHMPQPCGCEPRLLKAVTDGVWSWLPIFRCEACGTDYKCNCFKIAIEECEGVSEDSYGYAPCVAERDWIKANAKAGYREGICHICRGVSSDLRYCGSGSCSSVMNRYGPYVRKKQIEENIPERAAENLIREEIGVPKIGEGWVQETYLARLVQEVFPNLKVLREASPDWLGRQRLDIFIPDLALAIEYQGEQHYRPVSLFGGKEGLRAAKRRDGIKRDRCNQNGVKVVYFYHNETLTKRLVEGRLVEALQ